MTKVQMTLARWGTFAVGLVLAGGASYLGIVANHAQRLTAEKNFAAQLQALGAIVILDSQQKHVATVNLSLIQGEDANDQFAEALDMLPSFTRLGALDLSRTSITNSQTSVLGELTNLKSLTLNGTIVSDATLQHLSPLGQLEALNLVGTKVTNDGLTALTPLRRLKLLDLSGTEVVGGLEALGPLRELEWLLLRNISLDPEALAPLISPLCIPKLRKLSLDNTNLTDHDVQRLRDARPQLGVHVTPSVTNDAALSPVP